MTFRSLALKNVKENWRSYSAFFLSSLFSVAIFYIYYAFLVHPDVVNGKLFAANQVRTGMSFCLYLIAIFSFIFILYSSGSFLKSRKKEFGLFSLFGMTRVQLRKLVFIENMVIGLLSTLAGIAAGILFSKLFFMGLGAILELEEQIRFAVPIKAVVMTIIIFVGIFFVITLYTTIRMGKGQIIELLKAHKQPKGELKYSKWQVVVGLISIVFGYGLAVTMSPVTFIFTALPVLAFVVTGTYLLYSQLSIVFLNVLKRRKNLFYNKTNMLIIGQLGYKIKDNARILFTITILSAVVMTAMGTIYVLHTSGKNQSFVESPYAVAWVETADPNVEQLDRKVLDELIAKHELNVSKEQQINGLKLEQYKLNINEITYSFGNDELSTMIIPQSEFNDKVKSSKQLNLSNEEAVVSKSYFNNLVDYTGTIKGNVGDQAIELPVTEIRTDTVMNTIYYWSYFLVIVSDEYYEQLLTHENVQTFTIHGIELSDLNKSLPMLEELSSHISEAADENVHYTRNIVYQNFVQSTSLTIFIGMFICLLFFIAAGSLIYFKLFTERDEDVAMFKGLSRIGMTYKEMRKIITTQIGIIFFLPCIVGIIHALFAMLALDSLLGETYWMYAMIVFGIYVVMQIIYFIIASNSYLHSIGKGSKPVT